MAMVANKQVMRDFCEALGIDPSGTKRVILDLMPGDVPTFYVEHILHHDQMEALMKVMGRGLEYVKVEHLNEADAAFMRRDKTLGGDA